MPETRIPDLIQTHEKSLLDEWLKLQLTTASRKQRIAEGQLREHSREFIKALLQGFAGGSLEDIAASGWTPMRELLEGISKQRVADSFSPSETATFVFSFKQPLFNKLREAMGSDAQAFAHEIWTATQLLDKLGLFTTEAFLRSREDIISRQQQEMTELSTPVVQLWPGVLALPLIGTLDSARTQVIMQNLLEAIVSTGSAIAILDITGVPTVDTMVAQHLLKTVAAARLMGAECIISGIRPQIAQTIVHLGVALGDVTTKSTIAGAQKIAFERLGLSVVRKAGSSQGT